MGNSLTRRGVLTGAAVIASAAALPKFLRHTPIAHVVVDQRLPSSAAFASGFHSPRIHAVSAVNDLCQYWYTRLRAEVLADAGHIAGLTTWIDYVVMRDCAAEIGYSRQFHAEHQDPWGQVHKVSWIFAPRT